jgi:hypothetical protein
MTLRSLHLSPREIVQQKWQLQIPAGAEYGSVSASPDNRHLLWSMGMLRQRPSLWVQWLWRLNLDLPRPQHDERRFFLSDLYGDNMHSVLNCPLSGTDDFSPLWTPDSKHLSFIYRDQLYMVPIN